MTERALLDGFVFIDNHTLVNMERQPRAVYEFLSLGNQYEADIEHVADVAGIEVPRKSRRRIRKYAPREIAETIEVMAMNHAQRMRGTTRRDALGRRRRKKVF